MKCDNECDQMSCSVDHVSGGVLSGVYLQADDGVARGVMMV